MQFANLDQHKADTQPRGVKCSPRTQSVMSCTSPQNGYVRHEHALEMHSWAWEKIFEPYANNLRRAAVPGPPLDLGESPPDPIWPSKETPGKPKQRFAVFQTPCWHYKNTHLQYRLLVESVPVAGAPRQGCVRHTSYLQGTCKQQVCPCLPSEGHGKLGCKCCPDGWMSVQSPASLAQWDYTIPI